LAEIWAVWRAKKQKDSAGTEETLSPNGCPRKQSLSYPSWACSFSVARLVAFDLQLQLLELVVRHAGREVIAVELTEHRDRRHGERCESTSLLKRIRKKLAQAVDEDETPRFCYTTLQALKDSTPEDDEVWQMVGKPLEVFGLKDI